MVAVNLGFQIQERCIRGLQKKTKIITSRVRFIKYISLRFCRKLIKLFPSTNAKFKCDKRVKSNRVVVLLSMSSIFFRSLLLLLLLLPLTTHNNDGTLLRIERFPCLSASTLPLFVARTVHVSHAVFAERVRNAGAAAE